MTNLIKPTYRCSDLPRLISCPASVQGCNIPSMGSEYAQAGTDKHQRAYEMITDFIDGKEVFIDEAEVAERYAKYCIEHNFIKPEGEFVHEFGEFTLSGHPDNYRIDRNDDGTATIWVIDLKTGHNKVSAIGNFQLFGYCLLLKFCNDFNFNYIKMYGAIFGNFTTDENIEWVEYNTDHFQWLMMQLGDDKKNNYNPTPDNCTYCNYKWFCPALKQISDAIMPVDKNNLPPIELMETADLADLYKKVSIIKKYDDPLKNELKKRGINGEDLNQYGMKLSITDDNEFKPTPADMWSWVQKGVITEDKFNELVRPNITAIKGHFDKKSLEKYFAPNGEKTIKLLLTKGEK